MKWDAGSEGARGQASCLDSFSANMLGARLVKVTRDTSQISKVVEIFGAAVLFSSCACLFQHDSIGIPASCLLWSKLRGQVKIHAFRFQSSQPHH